MRQLLAVITILAAAVCAEEQGRVQQFTLADGRVLQAVRFIKIATPQKTTFSITLADGSKMTFDGEDVVKICDVSVPASQLPASLNEVKKTPVAAEPVTQVGAPPPPPVVLPPYSDVPVPVVYTRVYHRFILPDIRPRTLPPPSPVFSPPPPPMTSSDVARRAFYTIPGSPVTSPIQPRR